MPGNPPETRVVWSNSAEVCPAPIFAQAPPVSRDDRQVRARRQGRVRSVQTDKVRSEGRCPRIVHALEQGKTDDEEPSDQQEAGSLIATEYERGAPE